MTATKYRSIPVGRIPRLDRGGCRFESCLLYKKAVQALMVAPLTSNQEDRVRISGAAHWFVGVTANTPDCLSGAKGSIPLRTAENVVWCNG